MVASLPPPLHVTNKGSPMVITAEIVAQLRAHPYHQSRSFLTIRTIA
jgi:hypothetical protein